MNLKKNLKYIWSGLGIALIAILYGSISPIWHLLLTCIISGHYVAIPLGILGYELNPVLVFYVCIFANILYSIAIIYLMYLLKKNAKSLLIKNDDNTEIKKQIKLFALIKKLLEWSKSKSKLNVAISILIIATAATLGVTSGIVLAEAYSLNHKKYWSCILTGIILGCFWVTYATMKSSFLIN